LGVVRASISQIGPYRIEEKIGSGGMAAVYRAVREGIEGFERTVALKVLHPHLSGDEEYVEMFHAEARLASQLLHGALVPVNDLGVVEGTHFMAMDLLEGITLAELFRRFHKKKMAFPRGHGLFVLAEALDGLHYAHDLTGENGEPCNVVHRDLSPRNIVITRSGSVRLLDFGIARSTARRGQTQVGVIKGTVPYMAPEQARGEQLDRTADIFAAGVILHQLLTGDPPIADGKTDEQRRALACMEIEKDFKRVHVGMRPIVQKALQGRPENRYLTADEMGDDLRKALETLEPEYDSAMLAAMVTRELKRKERKLKPRAKKADAAKDDGHQPPDGQPERRRPGSPMRKKRRKGKKQVEEVAAELATRWPMPPVEPWDSARSLSLIAVMIVLLGMCYTFVPLAG